MTDLEQIFKSIKQQDNFINMLRAKVETLEFLLKNHVPNFEEQYGRQLFLVTELQKKRMEEYRNQRTDE